MTTKATSINLIKKFFEHDPLDAAHSLETMDEEEVLSILRSLPVHLAVEAFQFMELRFAARLVMNLPEKQLKEILEGFGRRGPTRFCIRTASQSSTSFIVWWYFRSSSSSKAMC